MDAQREHNGGLEEELQRERLLDIEQRLAPYRRAAFVVLGLALLASAPWVGWWWFIPLAIAALTFTFVDRTIPSSPRPWRWAAAGWGVSPLMIAVSVALTGAADSPAVAWFALPAITLMTRFERRGVFIGSVYIIVLLLGSTLLLEPSEVIEDPSLLLFALALVAGTLLFSGAIVDSDREHRQSSVVDPLTGLLNRAALAQRVGEGEVQLDGSRPRSLGLLIADLDHFKRINDRHGHATGDAVLRDVAYAIRGALRSFDLAYRIGGEEFLVLLPGSDEGGVTQVGERLRSAAAQCSREGIEVRLSLGGAWGAGEEADFARLSAAADAALYEAKRSGRDRLHMAPAATRSERDGRPRHGAELGLAELSTERAG